jgi:N-acetylglucosamine repressor
MQSPEMTALNCIYRSGSLSRRTLSEQTGATAGRSKDILARLLAHRLIVEEVQADGGPGRPAALLRLNPSAGWVVGLDIGGTHSRAVLTRLDGQVVSALVHASEPVPDREIILANIVRLIEAVCRVAAVSVGSLTALGIGLRGIVDSRLGVVLDWPNTPSWASAWSGLDLTQVLRDRIGLEVIVADESVRAMGVASHRSGAARGSTNFVYLFLGAGIGAAVFVNGQPYAGSIGLTGELGHVSVDENGPWCSCGNRGCLEVVASTHAVLRRVRDRLSQTRLTSRLQEAFERDTLTLATLIESAGAGDKLAFQILDETGTYVGKVLAITLNLLGPELVVLAGPLAQDHGIMLEAVQRQVRLHALQHISRQTRIVCEAHDDLTGARGASMLALDYLFGSDVGFNSLLRQRGSSEQESG